MRLTIRIRFWVLLLLLVFGATSVNAQQPAKNPYDPAKLKRFFEESSQKYKMVTESGETLQRRDKVSLTMRNDERLQDQTGSIYLWEKKNGQPGAFVMIFIYWYNGKYYWRHELLSMLQEKLHVEYDGKPAWFPDEKALVFAPVKDASAPGPAAGKRLTQMRQIAREFQSDLKITGHPPAQLILMPTPIHRYEVPSEGIVDGALFSMAVGTDFELLLVLEARKQEDGTLKWHWAAGRGHYHELELRHKNTVVWRAPRIIELEETLPAQMPYATLHYFLFTPDQALPPPEELK